MVNTNEEKKFICVSAGYIPDKTSIEKFYAKLDPWGDLNGNNDKSLWG